MSEPGGLRPTRKGWALIAPTHCRNGHPLGGGQVLVGTTACDCGGRHTTWWCRQPGCDDTQYGPPLGDRCSPSAGIDGR